MPYSQFSFREVKKQFGLTHNNVLLFEHFEPIPPSVLLTKSLERSLKVAYFSEKSRSEAIVMPLLLELRDLNHDLFAIYSGANLDADKSQGLNGECDFILSNAEQSVEVESPIFCLIEAKDDDIENSLGQNIAQMIGARLYNEQDGIIRDVMYGCVTTGVEWQFMKLQGNVVYIDTRRYFLNKLEEILGVIQTILDEYK